MSSKIFAFAEKAYRRADKYATKMSMTLGTTEAEEREWYDKLYNSQLNIAKLEFNKILDISEELHNQFLQKFQKQSYFITVRPDTAKIDFYNFTDIVNSFVHRKCIKKFTLSYEQKGTSEDTLGNGFHVHIICDGTWRSKGEALRDTQSTFKSICAPNCVQVDTTKNPDEVINKYLIEYESKDDHKSCTKEWDDLWRQKLQICNMYINENVTVTRTPVYQVQFDRCIK